MRILQGCLLVACLMAGSALAAPGDAAPASCEEAQEMLSPTQHLRALSLDLTGDLPSLEALQEVQSLGEVPADMGS